MIEKIFDVFRLISNAEKLMELAKDIKVHYNVNEGYIAVTSKNFEATLTIHDKELRGFILALAQFIVDCLQKKKSQ